MKPNPSPSSPGSGALIGPPSRAIRTPWRSGNGAPQWSDCHETPRVPILRPRLADRHRIESVLSSHAGHLDRPSGERLGGPDAWHVMRHDLRLARSDMPVLSD